jgi:hypothetical protein
LGSLSPSTVIDRVGILLFPFSVAKRKKDSEVFPQKFQAAWLESSITRQELNAISPHRHFFFLCLQLLLATVQR